MKILFKAALLTFTLLLNNCNSSVEKSTTVLDLSSKQNGNSLFNDINLQWAKLTKFSSVMDSIMADEERYLNNEKGLKLLENTRDSIEIINFRIATNIIQKAILFSKEDIKNILSLTEIKQVSSADSSLLLYNWDMGIVEKSRSYENILVVSGDKFKHAFHYGGIDSLGHYFGNSTSIDTIISIPLNKNKIYLIAGSNRCGSMCILNKLEPVRFVGQRLVKDKCVFRLKDTCYNDIEFTYFINQDIQEPLQFICDQSKLEVFVPKLDLSKTEVIGKQSYKLDFSHLH